MKLAELVDNIITAETEVTVESLTATVLRETPDDLLEDFYAEALPFYLRTQINLTRNSAINAAATEVRRQPAPSRKMAAVRDYWQQELDSMIAVGDGAYKRLRDCTSADLKVAIETRLAHIQAVQSKINHYESMIEAMTLQGVETVGELSGPVS
ncbi:hypothetical protein SEA_RAJELICIA_72 [Mycobacterium phage Rajelicia]|nr:hypothetical protein SEA_RAJELICIA_72 [Mycobacterium phage Rajelicia]